MRIWNRRGEGIDRSLRRREGLVAVAVDNDKSSQRALKWAVEHYIPRGRCINLVHVKQKSSSSSSGNHDALTETQFHNQTIEMFRPLRCFCLRRQVQSEIAIVEDQDVAKALIEYVHQNGVATLMLGAPSKNSLARLFKGADIPSSVMRWAPDFCNVFIISKGKLAAVRSASRPVPAPSSASPSTERLSNLHDEEPYVMTLSREEDRLYDELSRLESDISFASSSSGKPGSDVTYLSFYESLGGSLHGRDSSVRPKTLSSRSRNPESLHSRSPNRDFSEDLDFSSQDYLERASCSSQDTDETDDEMRRLKMELKHTMDMYHAACKEALTAKQKAIELEKWKKQEEHRLAEVKKLATESASEFMESEKAKHKAAMESVEAKEKTMELEVQKRVEAELKALKEAVERRKILDALGQSKVALKYQSLLHIFACLFLFYFYFSVFIV